LELDREPFESEVQAEMRRQEEEMRNAAKKPRKSVVLIESDRDERRKKLEVLVTKGPDELQHLKQDMRKLISAFSPFRDTCGHFLAVTGTLG
jgi:hypothetical protein